MLQYSLTSSAKVRIFIQRFRAQTRHVRMWDRNMFKLDPKDNLWKSGLIVMSVSRICPGRMYHWKAKFAQERLMTRQMLLWSKSWVCILYYQNCHFSYHLARCPRLSPHTPRPYHCSCYSNTCTHNLTCLRARLHRTFFGMLVDGPQRHEYSF